MKCKIEARMLKTADGRTYRESVTYFRGDLRLKLRTNILDTLWSVNMEPPSVRNPHTADRSVREKREKGEIEKREKNKKSTKSNPTITLNMLDIS